MLRKLRIQLTLLYLLAGMLLVAIMGAGLYLRLTSYFQSSTDLALKYRLALELRSLKAPVTPILEEAEKDFLSRSRLEQITNTPTNIPLPLVSTLNPPEGDGSKDITPPESTKKPGDDEEHESFVPGSGGTQAGKISAGFILIHIHPSQFSQNLIPTATPSTSESEDEDEESEGEILLVSELAPIFILSVNSGTNITQDVGYIPAPMKLDQAALSSATANNIDLRTVVLPDGRPVRLLTYHLPAGFQADYLQLGRPIDDQMRLLNQYLISLIGISLVCLLFLTAGSWWLAGKSLLPTQKSIEQQQEFIANASHELRTPLTLIRASTELAARSIPNGEPHKLLGDVLMDVDYMTKMVEDLLILSRLDNQKLVMDCKPVSLRQLLNEIGQQTEQFTQNKNIKLEIASPDLFVQADPDRLRQVIWILLDNAIQHTPPGGKISIIGVDQGIHGIIQVSDTGVGISTNDLPYIFDRFYKAKGRKNESHGAGLGLSIAKRLIDAQYGSIQVESTLGKGTQFLITLKKSVR